MSNSQIHSLANTWAIRTTIWLIRLLVFSFHDQWHLEKWRKPWGICRNKENFFEVFAYLLRARLIERIKGFYLEWLILYTELHTYMKQKRLMSLIFSEFLSGDWRQDYTFLQYQISTRWHAMTWIFPGRCDLTIKDIHVLLTSNTSVVESLWTPQPTKYEQAGHERSQPQFFLSLKYFLAAYRILEIKTFIN
mgnify:FL=1